MMPHGSSPISPTTPTKFPPPTRSATLPVPPRTRSVPTDRTLLAPEDAIYLGSPPHRRLAADKARGGLRMTNGDTTGDDSSRGQRRGRNQERMSSSRRRKVTWKKLLWVKQSCSFLKSPIAQSIADFYRSRQLHRPRNISRTFTEEPSSSAIRLLATRRRLDCHRPASMFSDNIYCLLRRHLPGEDFASDRRWTGNA